MHAINPNDGMSSEVELACERPATAKQFDNLENSQHESFDVSSSWWTKCQSA